MRPLDFLGRIKAKLGIVILLAVAVAILVNEYGRYLGVPGMARMAVAGLISLAMAQLVGRGMTRPLRQMAAAAQTIAKGRYDLRVSATSRDEVGELARAFNAMAADLGEVDRQRRELVANVSHELRTPITGLQAVLENVVDGVSPPDRATLGTALAQTERLGRLVTQLLDLSRLDSGARLIEPELFDLAALCRQAVRESRLARDDVRVEYSVPVSVTLLADPGLLAQVLANLLDNAVRHSPPGGAVLLRARVTEQTVQISITDQGPGIPIAERTRVFERFSRLDTGRTADAGGAGLGLAIAKEIVEIHGGTLQATDPTPESVPASGPESRLQSRSESRPESGAAHGTGCRMVIELPRRLIVTDPADSALPPAAAPPTAPEPPSLAGPSSPGDPTAGPSAADSPADSRPNSGMPNGGRPSPDEAAAAISDAPGDGGTRPSVSTGGPARIAAPAAESGGNGSAAKTPDATGSGDASGSSVRGSAGEGDGDGTPGAGHPVTDSPTVPTRIARGGDATAVGGAFRGDDTTAMPDAGGRFQGQQGGVSRGGAPGGETGGGGVSGPGRTPAERELSTADTLTSGISVAAVLGYPEHQAAGSRPPYAPIPQDTARPEGHTLTIRTVLSGVFGGVIGFFAGLVLALFAAVALENLAIFLATLMFATIAGVVIGAALGQRSTPRDARGQPYDRPAEGIGSARPGEVGPWPPAPLNDLSATGTAAAGNRPPHRPMEATGATRMGAATAPSGAGGKGVTAGTTGRTGEPGAADANAPQTGTAAEAGAPGRAEPETAQAGTALSAGSSRATTDPTAGTEAPGRIAKPETPQTETAPRAGGSQTSRRGATTGAEAPGRSPDPEAPQTGTHGWSGAPRAHYAASQGRRPGPQEQEYVPPSLFPRPVLPKAPVWLLPAAAVVGVVAAVALPYNRLGLGFVVVAVTMGLAVLPAARHRVTPWSIAFGLVAYALVTFAVFRDAEWLVAPLLAAAFGLGALAVSGGGRGWLGAIRGGMSVLLAAFQLPWFLSEPVKRLVPRRRFGPLVAGGVLTVGLVAIFGVLFVSADAVFSSLIENLFRTPDWARSVPVRVIMFAVFMTLAASAVLVALRPVREPVLPDLRLRVSRVLWMMPLTALNLLFAAFVAVQITVLFGGNERVLTTANLTYAEYARSGFFELVTVSLFVLAIVAAASGGLAVGRGRDRWWLAILLGLLCVLTLVILASAVHRLNLYVDAYGLSRLRAGVIATSWWLAAVFVLVIVAGAIRLTRGRRLTWLPRSLILLTGLSLVAFAAWNPDLRVAETQHHIRGVERLDRDYLGDLGAEAVPALDRLPEPTRSCLLRKVYVGKRLYEADDSWGGWNLAREQARDIINRHPIVPDAYCPN